MKCHRIRNDTKISYEISLNLYDGRMNVIDLACWPNEGWAINHNCMPRSINCINCKVCWLLWSNWSMIINKRTLNLAEHHAAVKKWQNNKSSLTGRKSEDPSVTEAYKNEHFYCPLCCASHQSTATLAFSINKFYFFSLDDQANSYPYAISMAAKHGCRRNFRASPRPWGI